MATALFLDNDHCNSLSWLLARGHLRIFVWLAKLKSKIRKPLLEFLRKPRTCGKPANEKCKLFMINRERFSRISEHTDRIRGEVSPEVPHDGIHG